MTPQPELEGSLYEGASNEGWIIFKVLKNDSKPVLSYGTKYDGTGGIWFKAY